MSNSVLTTEEQSKLTASELLNSSASVISENVPEALQAGVLEPSPEEQEAIINSARESQNKYIQDSFIKEGGDISLDVNKSNKRMIDVNIQQAILNYLSSCLDTPLQSMEHAFQILEERNLHLNVIPKKYEYNNYSISIEILQSIHTKSIYIKTSSNIEIS